ncbi:MAG: agmatine deiminase family protein [Clostridium sp.]|nr:agmatine deiminase family protein [Clostridium sp.]
MMNRIRRIGARSLMPAEWDCPSMVLMALPNPDTDWAPILDDALRCYRDMVDAILPFAPVMMLVPSVEYGERELAAQLAAHGPDRLRLVPLPYNDTWTRDYGPLAVAEAATKADRILLRDFTFNAWGMKFPADRDNLANRRLDRLGLLPAPLENRLETVLEGGSVDADGYGNILTTSRCLLSPNRTPNIDRGRMTRLLFCHLSALKIHWLDHGYLAGDDTDSHVDTLARFAPNRQIVYVQPPEDPADEHYEELTLMEQELRALTDYRGDRPFNLVGLPLPDPVFDPEGNRLPATYANFLALPGAVIMPTYGQPRKDKLARQILEVAFERPVVPVDCLPLVRQHGSLHCSTMQIPTALTIN